MPTIVTHALVGGALAPAGPTEVSRKRLVAALVILALLPDLDVLAFSLGIPYAHPLGHRGFSHSLPFAVLAAWGVVRFEFASVPRLSAAWWRLFGVLFVATASHGVLDAMTNGGRGVGFFIPFDSARHFFAFRPLAVSPIGVGAVFDDGMAHVLRSEIVFVWVPLAAIHGIAYMASKRSPALH